MRGKYFLNCKTHKVLYIFISIKPVYQALIQLAKIKYSSTLPYSPNNILITTSVLQVLWNQKSDVILKSTRPPTNSSVPTLCTSFQWGRTPPPSNSCSEAGPPCPDILLCLQGFKDGPDSQHTLDAQTAACPPSDPRLRARMLASKSSINITYSYDYVSCYIFIYVIYVIKHSICFMVCTIILLYNTIF